MDLSLSTNEIESLLVDTFANLTGLDPNKGEIRLAYQQQSQPGWRHTDSVIAFYINSSQNQYNEDITDNYFYNEDNDNFDKESTFTRVIDCNISCYGPLSRDLATKLWAGIQSDENRLNLSKAGIYPVPKVPSPTYMPYEYNQQWWERSDVTLQFNVLTKLIHTVNKLDSVDITIKEK